MYVTLTALPDELIKQGDFKSTLNGSHKFRVKKISDISKPEAKQIEEIEEPEEEATAAELKLNKSNARMILLELEDANNACIKAIETERIETLTDAKAGFIIGLQGPVELRCSRLMLEKRNVVSIEIGPREETVTEPVKEDKIDSATAVIPNVVETETQSIRVTKTETVPPEEVKEESRPPTTEVKKEDIQVISLLEDWDEDDEDDCIVLN